VGDLLQRLHLLLSLRRPLLIDTNLTCRPNIPPRHVSASHRLRPRDKSHHPELNDIARPMQHPILSVPRPICITEAERLTRWRFPAAAWPQHCPMLQFPASPWQRTPLRYAIQGPVKGRATRITFARPAYCMTRHSFPCVCASAREESPFRLTRQDSNVKCLVVRQTALHQSSTTLLRTHKTNSDRISSGTVRGS
jgi:hypothetical protein